MNDDLKSFKPFARTFVFNNRPFFDDDRPLFFGRAPGRLDVMGGIADYSGSLVLEMPLAEATLTAVQLTERPTIQIISLREAGESTFAMPLSGFEAQGGPLDYAEAAAYFRKTADSRWAAYIAGAFLVLKREKQVEFTKGARILIRSAVPEGKGVSSSAAVEVATMQAIIQAYDIPLDPYELPSLCQIVENRVAGAPCGIMDQMTVAHGKKDRLLALHCQPATIQGTIAIPRHFKFWGIDSGIRHAVSGADYGDVRIGAFMGYKIIQSLSGQDFGSYLANVSPSQFDQQFRQRVPETLLGADFLVQYGELPDALSTVDSRQRYPVQQPTAHPIYENFRVKTFAQLLAGDADKIGPLLGELMYQSHASYSACGLGSSGTDLLVELARELGVAHGIFGAKITGGGSGGTVVVLGTSDAQAAITTLVERYTAATGYHPFIFDGSSDGAI